MIIVLFRQAAIGVASLLVSLFAFSAAFAINDYERNLYVSATFLYWCTYKQVPTSQQDVARVTDVMDANPNLIMGYNDWLDALSYEINDGELTLINKSSVFHDGRNHSTLTSQTSTNCAAMKRTD
ncbi:MAG: hypothetical protein PVJ63_06085 [Thioalkalispiraceae bacterium]|jgi:hypothetical protein